MEAWRFETDAHRMGTFGMPRPLRLRVIPEPDESLFGFILRLAQRNLYPDAGEIVEAIGIRHLSAPIPESALRRLAALSSRPFEELQAMQPTVSRPGIARLHGRELPDEICARDGFRVCSVCLIERPVYRAAWLLSPYLVCPRHGIRLLDRCPECGRRLRRGCERLSFEKCPNGHWLPRRVGGASAGTSPSSTFLDWICSPPEPVPDALARIQPRLLSLPAREVLFMADTLARLLLRLFDPAPCRLQYGEIRRPLIDIGFEAMATWPMNLVDFLERPHIEATREIFSSRTAELLRLASRRLRNRDVPDIVSEAVRDYGETKGFLLGGPFADKSGGARKLISGSAAMATMGLPLRTFRKLIEAEGWKGWQGVKAHRRHHLLQNDVDRWMLANKGALGLQQSADILQCRTSTVRIVIDEGGFGLAARQRNLDKPDRRATLYPDEISKFVSDLERAVVLRPPPLIPLAAALRPAARWSTNLARAALAVLAGEIVPSAWDGLALGGLCFPPDEIDRLVRSTGLKPGRRTAQSATAPLLTRKGARSN